MKKVLLVAALSVTLSGCFATPVLLAGGGALVAGIDTYCTSLTKEAREKLREAATEGRQLLCEVE